MYIHIRLRQVCIHCKVVLRIIMILKKTLQMILQNVQALQLIGRIHLHHREKNFKFQNAKFKMVIARTQNEARFQTIPGEEWRTKQSQRLLLLRQAQDRNDRTGVYVD